MNSHHPAYALLQQILDARTSLVKILESSPINAGEAQKAGQLLRSKIGLLACLAAQKAQSFQLEVIDFLEDHDPASALAVPNWIEYYRATPPGINWELAA